MINEELKEYIKREMAQAIQIPVGAIFAFPSEKIPEGFLPCEGQELSCSQYPELFKLIGTVFGGEGKTFCLPDLQGQFIRGLDRIGNTDFQEDGSMRTIGDMQQDALQGHKHEGGVTDSDGFHSHEVYQTPDILYYGKNTFSDNYSQCIWRNSNYSVATDYTTHSGSHSHRFTIGGVSNDTFGKVRVASETRPKNMALIFCIKAR